MADTPWYAPDYVIASPQPPKGGEHVWSLRKAFRQVDRALRFHGESYGWECQCLHEGELAYGQRFVTRAGALAEAEAQRARLLGEWWRPHVRGAWIRIPLGTPLEPVTCGYEPNEPSDGADFSRDRCLRKAEVLPVAITVAFRLPIASGSFQELCSDEIGEPSLCSLAVVFVSVDRERSEQRHFYAVRTHHEGKSDSF